MPEKKGLSKFFLKKSANKYTWSKSTIETLEKSVKYVQS